MRTNYTYKTVPMSDVLDERKFEIPKFQRNVVWSQKKKKNFISAIRSGEPFGVILIKQKGNKYSLIDGLQRISTIIDFQNHPYSYLKSSDLDLECIHSLVKLQCKETGVICTEDYLNKESEELSKFIFENMKEKGANSGTIGRKLRKSYSFEDTDELLQICGNLYDKFKDSIDITSMSLYAIDYVGPDENVPNVFYNLNTGGVSLSKYETFAPIWNSIVFQLNDEEIIDTITNKYSTLETESDMDVDFDVDELRTNGITLFEYCYSLGEILHNSESRGYTFLKNNKTSTDPMGFELLSMLLEDNVNSADKLDESLKDVTPEFLIDMKKAILDTCDTVKMALCDTVVSLSGSSLCSDSMYQIYHIIYSYIKENYTIIKDGANSSIQPKKENHLSKNKFVKYLKYHYIYDNITGYWKNHRQVSDLTNEMINTERCERYWHSVSFDNWNTAINEFIGRQANVQKQIPYESKLFLDFYMRLKLSENQNYKKYFRLSGLSIDDKKATIDIEHITPKKVIEKHLGDLPTKQSKMFSVSPIGNLCYLSSKDNKAKRERSIYEFSKGRPSFCCNEEYLELIDYPRKEEITFFDNGNSEFRKNYAEFTKNRQNRILKNFLGLIKRVD